MKKRFLALMLAGVLALGALTGCSSPKNETEKKQEEAGTTAESGEEKQAVSENTGNEEAVDIEVWTGNIGYLDVGKDTEVYNFLKELTGVGITQPYVEWNGGETYQQQLNLKIASGEMPDMFLPVNGMEIELAKSGALLDLTELLPEMAPKLWNTVPEEVWDVMKSYDPNGEGRIYFIPNVRNYTLMGGMIRQDWLDALDLEMPTTQEEFVQVLEAFKTQDPNGNGIADEIPTGGREEAKWMDYLYAMYGIAMWEGKPDWDIYEGELTYSAVTQNMKDALEFISDLYARGLLDEETLLNDKAGWEGKIASDRVGVFYHWANYAYYYAEMVESSTGTKAEWALLPAIDAPGYTSYYTNKAVSGAEFVVANTDDEATIEAVMKVLNAYGDEDLLMDFYMGAEGMHHEVVDGERVRLADDKSTMQALIFEPYNTLSTLDFQIELLESVKTEDRAWAIDQGIRNIEELQQYGKTIAGDGMPASIYEGYADILNRTLYIEYASKIIIGEYSIDKFDEFVEKWYAAGGEEVTQAARAWYARVQE